MMLRWILCPIGLLFLSQVTFAIDETALLSTGAAHTCALDDEGVRCWGANIHGQISVPPLRHPTVVSAGGFHTCALDREGVKCWGWNASGQTSVPPLRHSTAVSAGGYHTCALDDGGVRCWGANDYGQTSVPPLKSPRLVSSGRYHTCALADEGVKCWGSNDANQTTVPPLKHPRLVSTGEAHTCAIDDEGVECWGWNRSGQTSVPPLKSPRLVSAGGKHTCALDDDGVKCWGENDGQTAAPPLRHPITVSAGWEHTCALDAEGVRCWGRDDGDQSTVPEGLSLTNFGIGRLPDYLQRLAGRHYGYKGRFFSKLAEALSGFSEKRRDNYDPKELAEVFTLGLAEPVIETTDSPAVKEQILPGYRRRLARAERRMGTGDLADIPLVSEVFAMSLAAARLSLASSRAFVVGEAERRRLETSQYEIEAIEAELKARGAIGPEPDAALVRRFSALLEDARPLITSLTIDSRTVGFGAVLEKIREYSAGGVAR